MSAIARAPYPPVTSFLWTVLRDLVSGLLLSLAMGLGWFTGVSIAGPEDWTARALGFVTFLLLGTLSLMTLRALLLRAADTAVVSSSPERPRLLADSTSASIGLGCVIGACLPAILAGVWTGMTSVIGLCLGLPLVLVGGAAFSVRWRIAARAARAPGGFDPRELDVPHAWWPLVVALVLLFSSVVAGAVLSPAGPAIPPGPRGELPGFQDLPAAGLGFGALGTGTPYVDEVRSRAECWRLRIERPGIYRITVRADHFAPVAILANEPRPAACFRREEALPGSQEVSLRWSWDSQRSLYLIVGAQDTMAEGGYQVILEPLGP